MIRVWYRPRAQCGERFELKRGSVVLGRYPDKASAAEAARAARRGRAA